MTHQPIGPGTTPRARPLALVVEDSPEYARLAGHVLEREGYDVLHAASAEDGLDLAQTADPLLVLIDVRLPGMDGFEMCRVLRTFSNAHVVMVTGLDEETERVVGLRIGADDYVTKPYSAAELGARAAAVRRRLVSPRWGASAPTVTTVTTAEPGAPADAGATTERTTAPVLHLDEDARELIVGGVPLILTRIEFDIARLLVRSPRRVWSREQLLEAVWGYEAWNARDKTVSVHVGNLRRKLRTALGGHDPITTVRGVGFRYDLPP